MSITLDFNNLKPFINKNDLDKIKDKIKLAINNLENKSGKGNNFLGWLNLPKNLLNNNNLIKEIESTAKYINENFEVFVVIGIGGSYLGANALIKALKKNNIEIIFIGNDLSTIHLKEVLDYIKNKKFAVNVISKSGTTTEPAIAFRFIRKMLNDKLKNKVFITTDPKKGALRKLAQEYNLKSFSIPPDVGGRFSVLTPVGLLPIAVAGIDIKELLEGAYNSQINNSNEDIDNNLVYKYAAYRNILYNKGYKVEVLSIFEPKLYEISKWWIQLFGESEGKENKGILPLSLLYTTDLHSMGQYLQQGERIIFETFLWVKNIEDNLIIPEIKNDIDNLNYLKGKTLHYVNQQAYLGTAKAHKDGKVPNMTINIDNISPYTLGELIYFFEKSVAISGYLLDINPFNQPGVEAYKTNMFKLLGKPGY